MNTTVLKSLTDNLSKLESHLETPSLPGEMADWIMPVPKLADDAIQVIQLNSAQNHEDLLASIAQEDSELLPRVEQLRETNSELAERWRRFGRTAKRLRDAIQKAEPDEARFEQHQEELVNDGLQLILDTRSQEKSITTWYVESVNRERGEVD